MAYQEVQVFLLLFSTAIWAIFWNVLIGCVLLLFDWLLIKGLVYWDAFNPPGNLVPSFPMIWDSVIRRLIELGIDLMPQYGLQSELGHNWA